MRRRAREALPMAALWAAMLLMLVVPLTATLAAQQPGPSGAGVAQPWSPAATAADLSRTLLGAPAPPSLLLAPPPVVGSFWSAGNPGAVAFDVREGDGYACYGAGYRYTTGEYRRPLDPAEVGVTGLDLAAFQRVGERGAAAGRVIAEDEALDPSSFGHVRNPYPSSPFMPSDSSTPALRRLRARLEGVLGWRLGNWGLGAGLGYDVTDNRTQASKLPRIGRDANPAVAVGAVRRLGPLDLTIGAFGRYAERVDEYTVIARGGAGTAWPLQGLTEPSPLVITSISPFFRRIERRARAYGLTLGGRAFGVTWAGFAADEHLREEQAATRQEDLPLDTWEASGWSAGLAAQGRLPRVGALVTGHTRYAKLTGDARRNDLEGIFFHGQESVLELLAEVRYAAPDSLWYGAIVVGTVHQSRLHQDFVAELQSDVGTWEPGVAVEIAHATRGGGTRYGVSAAYAGHYAASAIPNPTTKGPLYRLLIAPELSLDASQASTQALQATLTQRLRGTTRLWVRLGFEKLEPKTSQEQPALPLRPNGQRKSWSVSFGLLTN